MYTLSNGSTSKASSPTNRSRAGTEASSKSATRVWIDDSRWRFQREEMLPMPRKFVGGGRRYRAGRGSTVPLDLGGLK